MQAQLAGNLIEIDSPTILVGAMLLIAIVRFSKDPEWILAPALFALAFFAHSLLDRWLSLDNYFYYFSAGVFDLAFILVLKQIGDTPPFSVELSCLALMVMTVNLLSFLSAGALWPYVYPQMLYNYCYASGVAIVLLPQGMEYGVARINRSMYCYGRSHTKRVCSGTKDTIAKGAGRDLQDKGHR